MTVEGQHDVDGVLNAGRVVARVRDAMLQAIEPGMTTAELDALGSALLDQHGARSAPRVTYDFPGATCISVNEEAAHGIPGERVIRAGDVVNVDVSAELNGYFADTGATIVVPPVSSLKARLCEATQLALRNAVAEARAGAPLNRIGRAVEQTAAAYDLRIIRNLGGHGVGRSLHEEPKEIPTWADRSERRTITEGLVFTLEPFLSLGADWVEESRADGWTLAPPGGEPTVQYEHTLVATKRGPVVVTLAE